MGAVWRQVLLLVLVIVAAVALLNGTGVVDISLGDAALGASVLLLLPLILGTLRRYHRNPPPVFQDKTLGSIRAAPTTISDSVYQVGLGSIVLDFRQATAVPGEHSVIVNGVVGVVEVWLPAEVVASVDAEVTVGEVRVLGCQMSGVLRRAMHTSPEYAAASSKLHLEIEMAYGRVSVHQAT
ncbi:MAG: hypothetical protein EXR67_02395 [Dehalococcoidia bacterium]|nr:hypothetical protein [Dehalococcoidia bacterium]